jgi:predicted metal-dependent peptidase
MANCAITLMQCDTEIHSLHRYEAWEVSTADFTRMKMVGRGGTSLVPPFQWIHSRENENPIMPDAMIYLTDGFGDFPKHVPEFPCLWITPKEALDHFPFGQVLRVLEP